MDYRKKACVCICVCMCVCVGAHVRQRDRERERGSKNESGKCCRRTQDFTISINQDFVREYSLSNI